MTADAQLVFIQSLNESRELLKQLAALVDENLGADPECIHWGHVGDAKHIESTLRALVKFTRGQE